MSVYFIGVDVGTGSVRAALVSNEGKIIKVSVEPIVTFSLKQNFYEQSSENIWNSCVKCIKTVIDTIAPEKVLGLGFDATCSLVALDYKYNPLTVSPTGKNEQNVILWLDHRAFEETKQINMNNHPILRYVGGKISLEMEIPKLLWLKKNLKVECWDKAKLFLDLPDFLTWKATGCESRSLCSLVCKWTYEIRPDGSAGWNEHYIKEIGLEDLLEDNCRKIGTTVLAPGSPVGNGLTKAIAKELGLRPGTPVGTSIIDAHAGGLGLIGCTVDNIPHDFPTRLALICGTSTCHMAVSPTPTFVPGVWGPYYSAMVPGMWLNEGGQSATGKLLDHVIDSHPVSASIRDQIGEMHIQQYLSNLLEELAKKQELDSVSKLTEDLHVWPDFHGNRSPLSDPSLKGAVCGLTLSCTEESLALIYLATVQALAYGTRHIIESLASSGFTELKSIFICGGLGKNPLFVQTQADAANLPVVCPNEPESVLLGSAILGACAAGHFPDINTAIKFMGGKGKSIKPNAADVEFHTRKYKVFLCMLEDQLKYRTIMKS